MFGIFKKSEEKPEQRQIVIGGSENRVGTFDSQSSTWIYISNHLVDRIDFLHNKNDNVTLSMEKTQAIRGAIKELKQLLDLPNKVDKNK